MIQYARIYHPCIELAQVDKHLCSTVATTLDQEQELLYVWLIPIKYLRTNNSWIYTHKQLVKKASMQAQQYFTQCGRMIAEQEET